MASSAEGEPLDRAKHAYDMAYVLFGLAWLASGERRPRAAGRGPSRTMDYLDAHLRDPRRGGYRAAAAAEPADADDRPRELAAQMHLLEAFQALHQATGEGAWLARAEEMVAFILERLIDRETGSLGELYTADWAAPSRARRARSASPAIISRSPGCSMAMPGSPAMRGRARRPTGSTTSRSAMAWISAPGALCRRPSPR